jgi:hypothetical protein
LTDTRKNINACAFKNRTLRIFWVSEVTEGGKNCVMWKFIICTLIQMKEDELDGECRSEILTQYRRKENAWDI